MSDYVPYWLSFIPKLQSLSSMLKNLCDSHQSIATRLFELESLRERARELHQEMMNLDFNKNSSLYVLDFIDVLLQIPLDNGKLLSDTNLINIVMDMMNAGTDMISIATKWALLELIWHHRLMQRAQEEVDKVLGTNCFIEEERHPKAAILAVVIKETFRMHPPIAINMPQEATHPSTEMGYEFPACTQFITNIHSIHRDPNVHENPDSFDPDRFLETSGAHSQVDSPFWHGVVHRHVPNVRSQLNDGLLHAHKPPSHV